MLMLDFYMNQKSGFAGGVALVIEHLPRRREALSSNPSNTHTKKKNQVFLGEVTEI
jgi:hypothetical protein